MAVSLTVRPAPAAPLLCSLRWHRGLAALLALAAPLSYLPSALALGAGAPFAPPARVASPAAVAAVVARSASASAPTSETPADMTMPMAADLARAAAGSGLNGIQLGAQPRALIDGEWVAPGEAVRGARLHSLRADEAQLRYPDGRLERLRLTPLVELQRQPPSPAVPLASRPGALRAARLISESP